MVATLGIMQNYAVLTEALLPNLLWTELKNGSDPLLKLFPLGYEDADVIQYDQWQDPYGLTALRGLDGPPPIVTLPGLRVYRVSPNYYGNKTQIRESQIVKMREPGTPGKPVEMDGLMNYYMMYFSTQAGSRIRQTAADMLTDGTFTNTTTDATNNTSNGSIIHTYTIENYRTVSPANDGNTGPSWVTDPTNAKPINDQLYWQNYLQLGTSTSFGNDSTLLAQQAMMVYLMKTKQIQETYRDKYGSSITGPEGVNQLQQGFGLPKWEIYNEGYNPTLADVQAQDLTAFTRFIPASKFIWMGKRKEGQQVGAMKFTRNANKVTSGTPGYPTVSIDPELPWSEGIHVAVYFRPEMPAHYDYEIGFNFCPVSYYPYSTAGGDVS